MPDALEMLVLFARTTALRLTSPRQPAENVDAAVQESGPSPHAVLFLPTATFLPPVRPAFDGAGRVFLMFTVDITSRLPSAAA